MCFYTKQKEPKIASEDIKGYKLLVRDIPYGFVPYFVKDPRIEFDTVLVNDSKLSIFEDTFMKEWEVTSGIFHIFKNVDPIKMCLHRHEVRNHPTDHIFVAEAIIPKGTPYFSGWSATFTVDDDTYASTNIIYKNPIQIDKFLKSI